MTTEARTHGALDLGTTTICAAYVVESETGKRGKITFLTEYPEAIGSMNPFAQVTTPSTIAYRIKRGGVKEIRWGAAVDRTTRNNGWHVFRNLKAMLVDSPWTKKAQEEFSKTLDCLNEDFETYGTVAADEPMKDLLRALSEHWQQRLRSQKLPELSSLTICVPANFKVAKKRKLTKICEKAFGFPPLQEFPTEAEAALHAMLETGEHGFEVGDRVIVLDMGGMTSDSSTFEISSLDPAIIDESGMSNGCPVGALRLNEEFDEWLKEKISSLSDLDIAQVTQLRKYATREFETEIKFSQPGRDVYTIWECGKDRIVFTEEDRVQIWNDALKDVLTWAVDQVKSPSITKIVPIGGLWKNLHMQEKFRSLVADEKIHEVIPTNELLTLVALGGLVAESKSSFVRSRYLTSNICYELLEPYDVKLGPNWEVCERRRKERSYVRVAALAFPTGSKVYNSDPHHIWLFREAKTYGDLKADISRLRKTLYIYDGSLLPFQSRGIDLKFWNAKDCAIWKTLELKFDETKLNGMKKEGKFYRFYYRLDATIDGLKIIFNARARPDGQWKTQDLTMEAECSTLVDGNPLNSSSNEAVDDLSMDNETSTNNRSELPPITCLQRTGDFEAPNEWLHRKRLKRKHVES